MARTPLHSQRTTPSRQELTRMQVDVPQGAFGGGQGLSALGRALSQFGNSLGAELERRDDRTRKFNAATDFANFSTRTSLELSDLQRDYNPANNDFLEQADSFYKAKAEEFLSTLPKEEQQEYRLKLAQQRGRVVGQALEFQYKEGDEYFRSEINDVYQQGLTHVRNSPDAFDIESEKIADAVMDADLPEAEKLQMVKNMRRGLQGARYKGMVLSGEVDPSAIWSGDGSIESYFNKLSGAESGGNPDAKASTSSATGIFQFTSDTWAGLINRYPEAGLTPDGRKDPKQQQIAIRLFTGENADILRKNGHAVTHANLHTVHFLGKGDGPRVLNASDDTPIEEVVAAASIRANPAVFKNIKTAGDLKRWSERKMDGDGSGIDPRFDALSYKDREQLYDSTTSELNSRARQQQQQLALQQSNNYEGLYTGVLNNDPNVTKPFILDQNSNGQLNASQTTRLLKALEDQTTAANAQGELDLAMQSRVPVDPTNPDIQKAADRRMSVTFGDSERFRALVRSGDPDAIRAGFGLSTSAGVVPPVYASELVSELNSGLPGSVTGAAMQIHQIAQRRPSAAAQAFKSGVIERAGLIGLTAEYYGIERANELAARMIDPNQRQNIELLRTEGNAKFTNEMKDMSFNELATHAGYPFGVVDRATAAVMGQSTTVAPAMQAQFTNEYRTAWTTAYSYTGDEDVADDWAKESMQKTWGTTIHNGVGVFMKYPIDRVTPGWTDETRTYHINKTLGATEDDKIQLVATTQTGNRVRNGFQPTYQAVNLDTYELYVDDAGLPVVVDFAVDDKTRALTMRGAAIIEKENELAILQERLSGAEQTLLGAEQTDSGPIRMTQPEDMDAYRRDVENLREEYKALEFELEQLREFN